MSHSKLRLYAIVLLLLLITAEASTIFVNIFIKASIFIILSAYLLNIFKSINLNSNLKLIYIILLHFTLTTMVAVFEGNLDSSNLNRNIGYYILITSVISLSYILIQAYGIRLYIAYSNVMYYFAAISLVLYALQLVSPDLVFNFIKGIQNLFNIPTNKVYTLQSSRLQYATSLFYTINTTSGTAYYDQRNSGFCFEATAFASFLLLAIIINLVVNNLKINRQLIVIIIALLTTFSTTGYIGLIFILIWYGINIKRTAMSHFIVFPLLVVATISAISSDFIFTKINQSLVEYEYTNARLNDLEESTRGTDDVVGLGRGGSLNYMLKNEFSKHPLIGSGGLNTGRASNLSLVSGIGEILVKFGLLGFIIYLVRLLRGSTFIVPSIYRFKSIIFLLIIINMITLDYSSNVFFLSFLFATKDVWKATSTL